MPDAAKGEPAVLPPSLLAFFVAIAIAGAAAFLIGGRLRPAPPTSGSVLVWSGTDGARYYVDTSTAHLIAGSAARTEAVSAYYVAPLQFGPGRLGFPVRARVREDGLTLDCANRSLDGSSVWQNRGFLGGGSDGVSSESVFAGAGSASAPRAAALRYACQSPAHSIQPLGAMH